MNYFSNKSDFTFIRKLTIKSLFDAKGVFNQFSDLHFLSFKAFSNFIHANLYTARSKRSPQYIHINIATLEELKAILQITQATKFDKETILTLHFELDILDSIADLITDQKIELSMKPETVEKMNDSKIVFSVPYWVEYMFNAENYAEQYEKLVKLWLINPKGQLIDLRFDYATFEDKPLSELHKLYFYMNMLRTWTQSRITSQDCSTNSNDCCNTTGNGSVVMRNMPSNFSGYNLTFRKRNNPIRCYIDEDLGIRLNKNEVYFPMSQYLGKNGEELLSADLNRIRKIIDIKFDTLITNQYFIDLDQNFKVMGDYYQIPYTTQLICEWLGLTVPINTLTKHVHTLSNIKKLI
jgi:hypothetical protein